MFIESPEDALRSFGGELGRHLALAYDSGANLFGMRIPDASRPGLYFALEDAYEAIVGQTFDWVVPLVIDDGEVLGRNEHGDPESLAGQLSRFCMVNLSRMTPSIGLIQVSPDADSLTYPIRQDLDVVPYSSLVAAVSTEAMGADGNPIKVAALVAAYLSELPRNRGVTGAPVGRLVNLNPAYLSDSQINKMSRRGILVVDYSVRKGIALQNAVTQNPNGPSLSSLRALFHCLHSIRYGLRPMIGEPQTPSSMAAEERIIQDVFDSHPWIVDYSFSLQREGLHERVIRASVLTQNEVSRADVLARVT